MANPDSSRPVKNWVVKSSTKILGPFTREEVMALLSRRQITIIDEIRQPEGRWNYIRDHRHFKEIVKNLRYEQDHSRDDTMTSTATVGNQTQTMTKTESPLEDLTPTPLVPPTPAPPPPTKIKPVIKDVTPVSESMPRMVTTPITATKSYGNLQDQRVRKKIQRQNFILRSLLFAFFIGAAVFLGWNSMHREKKVELSYDQLLNSALRYKELGLYDMALAAYKKAAAIREPDLESQFQMAFLLINEDRQSLAGRRIIEKALMKEGRSPQELMQGQLGIALSYMMEGDLNQADDFLQKALGFDANNESAKINQAVVALKKGDFSQAYHDFDDLGSPSVNAYPLVLLGKSISLIEVSKDHPNKELLKKDIADVRTFISKSHFMRKELALLMINLNQLADDSSGALDAVTFFLEEPQEYSHEYVRDLTLDWRNAEWDSLEKYCSDMYASGKGPVTMKAVRAVCLIETNRDLEANKLLEEALAQGPKQLSNLEAQAQYLWKLDRQKEALTLFQTPESKSVRLALYLQGDTCLKAKDYACAETAYKTLADRDFGDVVAHYGLAQTALGRNDKLKAQAEIKSGFEAEINFTPLIKLREKMETP